MRRTPSLRLSVAVVVALAALATVASASSAASGTGFSASPASLDFSNVPTGTSETAYVSLTNNSGQNLWFSGTFKGGPDRNAWTVVFDLANCPGFGGLAPGVNCSAPVTFAPQKKGKHRSTLVLSDSLGDSLSITLTGTGT